MCGIDTEKRGKTRGRRNTGEGTLVNLAAGGGERQAVTFGHPSGTLKVGATANEDSGDWVADKAIMSRSARVLMEGWVFVPGDTF